MATRTYTNGGNMQFAPVTGHVDNQGILGSIASTILNWQERASMRHQLASLDKEYLNDMGLSTSAVKLETSKSFWQS
ncbi:DUF1127 domain-containing protein [Sneathiella litorea]|uniref:DUF1127 domain-containing protein n=1 Tax=Sneathiella litorea TaxID=2606216 RepID=A0A6L8WDI7_9PROT|nr:DUF1127 domain-containing protein [Sneathiella litorea]MZR32432.1 DUF1127 domain-containing protein [Sneathiella litorea]